MPLSIFKVRIIRVISVTKSGKVEQIYLLFTVSESYEGFSIRLNIKGGACSVIFLISEIICESFIIRFFL